MGVSVDSVAAVVVAEHVRRVLVSVLVEDLADVKAAAAGRACYADPRIRVDVVVDLEDTLLFPDCAYTISRRTGLFNLQ